MREGRKCVLLPLGVLCCAASLRFRCKVVGDGQAHALKRRLNRKHTTYAGSCGSCGKRRRRQAVHAAKLSVQVTVTRQAGHDAKGCVLGSGRGRMMHRILSI